jgi:multidrug resistance efflux pump
MEIVPVDDEMFVEAVMPPSEVAYVEVHQPARIKLRAYDLRRYGELDGVVRLVSPDVLIEDAKGGGRADSSPFTLVRQFPLVITLLHMNRHLFISENRAHPRWH